MKTKMKLSKRVFRAWLEANPRRRFLYSDPCGCALAKYCRLELGRDDLYVGAEGIYRDEDLCRRVYELPNWAKRFVDLFDTVGPNTPDGRYALRCLNKVEDK